MRRRWRSLLDERSWEFAPHERPTMPGSPAAPEHPRLRRAGYGLIALLVGVTGGLGNALVAVNTTTLQGALGLYSNEVAWLPAAYVMTSICINLVLIKFRQEFGLRRFVALTLLSYALITFSHLFVRGFGSAIAVRAASGVAGAGLSTLALYYMIQAFPARWRIRGVVLGIGVPQLATPMARLFSTELLAENEWRTLYLFELGLALLSLAAVWMLPLPPSERRKAFEPLDFLTFLLLASGMALLCAVLAQGRIQWWTEARWIGWALALAIPLVAAALVIEHNRSNPLLNTRWLGSADIVRFAVVAILVRICLSEQTYAAVGLLNTLGLNNDQLHDLFGLVLAATAAGSIASAIAIDPNRLAHPIMLAVGLVAIAAFADAHATNLTRAPQMYLTQTVLAFSATFFMGPALLFGMSRALQQGPAYIVSFSALFGITQSLGGLAGSALLGTYQTIREKAHSHEIVQDIVLTNPIVANRLQQSSGIFGPHVLDPALRNAQGAGLLSQQITREANILAYNDTFFLIGVLASLTTLYLGFLLVRAEWRRRRAESLSIAAAGPR